jgi:hypothetical protein
MLFPQFKHIVTGIVLSGIISFSTYADDVAEKGRAILEQNRDAVITIELVLKRTISFPGSPSQEMEQKSESTGTVISVDGLTVVSLSEVDPSVMMDAMMSGNPQMNGLEMDTQVQDAKMLLSDGTEIPAEVILRDKDLDMAFIRPIEKAEKSFTHVNISDPGTPLQLDQVISINKLGKVVRRAHAVSVERIDAIVTKPRTFFVPGKDPTNSGLGAPAFTLDGKFIGVFFIRAIKAIGGGGMGGMFGGQQDNVAIILLPAIDIQEAAEQAPPF